MWGMHRGANAVPQLLDLAWTWPGLGPRSCADQGANRAGNLRRPGANYVLPNIIISQNLRYFRGDDLVGISRLPWRRHRPAQTVSVTQTELLYLLFLALLGSPDTSNQLAGTLQGEAVRQGFFATPYSSPRCVEYRAGYPRHWKSTRSG